ncbi:MAG: ABC transporter permease [bacterium]|nr:ABC transporter permease [bacterium]
MSTIWTLATKDLLLLWRDKVSLFWMFGMPLIFAAFFGAVFGGGGGPSKSNPLRVAVIEEGLTDGGREFAERLDASDAIAVEFLPRDEARDAVRRGRKLAFLEIVNAPDPELGMFSGETPEVVIGIDPSRQAAKGLLQGLVTEAVFAGFRDLMTSPEKTQEQLKKAKQRIAAADDIGTVQKLALTGFFTAFETFLATPDLTNSSGNGGAGIMEPQVSTVDVARVRTGPPNAYAISFPQSILWGILGAAAGFAMALVRERTSGTMVRLLTAPIGKGHLIAGKTLACALSCCLVAVTMTTIGAFVFGVTVNSIPLFALAVAASAVCFAGITMLLGSLARTEQAVSGITWGILLVCAMLGGGMMPQIAMPGWMLDVGAVSPARWTITALEGAIWRGFSASEMLMPCGILFAIGIVALALGTARLRRTD